MPPSTAARHHDLFTSPEAQAERILLDLADYLYGNAALKPMSKTLFALSRLMLVVRRFESTDLCDAHALAKAYRIAHSELPSPLADDFAFKDIATLCEHSLPRIVGDLRSIVHLLGDGDGLGLLFNTLVRGKWDAGEGMGTFLTPQEVVDAIVAMVFTRNDAVTSDATCFAGDICGGTGRFPFALARAINSDALGTHNVEPQLFSFDQSSLATDYARLNLHFLGLEANCQVVDDSLVNDAVGSLKDCCSALATNPPFGTGKYRLSPATWQEMPHSVLDVLVGQRRGQAVDPALLFVFRNLDLLRSGGVLGIVLPDGVVRSNAFVRALKAYEHDRQVHVEVRAIVSLPTVTFALGGTVAKTSFLIVSKDSAPTQHPLFIAHARHIGYLKQGNARVADDHGNDLPGIVRAYQRPVGDGPGWDRGWRDWNRLGVSLAVRATGSKARSPLSRYCAAPRDYTHVDAGEGQHFHVSVLDVDETGLIDVLASMRHRPTSRVVACRSDDVLLSCINPRIWRVAVVPSLQGSWTCSAEFLVLRPTATVSPWELAMRLHHRGFQTLIQSMAGGTSSSRQRVDKDAVLDVPVPRLNVSQEDVQVHAETRQAFYKRRLVDGCLYDALHRDRPVERV